MNPIQFDVPSEYLQVPRIGFDGDDKTRLSNTPRKFDHIATLVRPDVNNDHPR
jgi:hypothetical protein